MHYLPTGNKGYKKGYLVPERKVMFRLNANVEILNPKQIRISNDEMTQNNTLEM